MRFYETPDVDFYINKRNGWDTYCTYGEKKRWSPKTPPLDHPRRMNHYMDLKGNRMLKVEDKDLYIKNWDEPRIDPKACLPQYYCGIRFIKVEQAKPLNFRCRTFPMNLKELRQKIADMKAHAAGEGRRQFLAAKLLEECQKKKDASK